MTRSAHQFAPFRKVLAPVLPGYAADAALDAALQVTDAQNILLLGLVVVPAEEPLAFGMLAAREVRATLGRLSAARGARVQTRVRVTHAPWREIVHVVQQEEADLLVVGQPLGPEPLPAELLDGLARPPCDVLLTRGMLPAAAAGSMRILAPVRGGPYAELAIRIALTIARAAGATVTALHVRPPASHDAAAQHRDSPYHGLAEILNDLPDVALREIATDDEAGAILAASRDADLVVMGSAARLSGASLGVVTDRVLRESPAHVLMVRTRRAVPAEPADPAMAEGAIALLVDRWLAENTYHADEFADLRELMALKAQSGATISLAVPARNAEATVGKVLRSLKSALYDRTPLLDEIVLIDAGSTDRTREVAADLGVPVFSAHEILPQYGALRGRGETLWKSLYITRSDLVVWADADLTNPHPRWICGLVGPLLRDARIQYVKGFSRRPTAGEDQAPLEDEQVAELAVRPLLSLLYPELSGVLQLLGGVCAGRRAILEHLPFHAGHGAQISLLLEIFDRHGLPALAQVDLGERLGHAGGGRRSPEALAQAAYAALQVFLRKLERRHGLALVKDINRTMKLVRGDAGRLHLELQEVREHIRAPLIDIPEYAAHRGEIE